MSTMTSTILLEVLPQSMQVISKLASDCLDGSFSIHHLRVLILVKKDFSQTEMSGRLQISEAAISKTISGLVEKKLLSKCAGIDKRSRQVSLTAEGTKILTQVKKEVEAKINKGLKLLSVKEKNDLALGLSALDKLMTSIKED